jgi:UDP-glucose 4-epimerase
MAISLVTGGAGFVGSHLVDALLTRGHWVRVLDDFSSGTRANLPESHPRLHVLQADLANLAAISEAIDGVDFVFHLAAPSHATASANVTLDRWAGTIDTLNVLAAAHKAGVKRLVYSSCESVYGPVVSRPLVETDATLPLSPYAFAKLAGEQQCVAYSAICGLETVRLRYFSVFGPRQASSGMRPSAIGQLLLAMLHGHRPTIAGDGNEPQDFIYVDDVVHANLLAAEVPRVSGKVFNIARGHATTLNEVVATINSLLGANLKPHYIRDDSAARGSRLTDIGRAEVDLGFCAGTDLEQGLRGCIAYHRQRPEPYGQLPRGTGHRDRGPHFVPDVPGQAGPPLDRSPMRSQPLGDPDRRKVRR